MDPWLRNWVDYYDELGVSQSATPGEIRAAYRALAQKFHPDRNPGQIDRMKRINAAYTVLSNPKTRSRYNLDYRRRQVSRENARASAAPSYGARPEPKPSSRYTPPRPARPRPAPPHSAPPRSAPPYSAPPRSAPPRSAPPRSAPPRAAPPHPPQARPAPPPVRESAKPNINWRFVVIGVLILIGIATEALGLDDDPNDAPEPQSRAAASIRTPMTVRTPMPTRTPTVAISPYAFIPVGIYEVEQRPRTLGRALLNVNWKVMLTTAEVLTDGGDRKIRFNFAVLNIDDEDITITCEEINQTMGTSALILGGERIGAVRDSRCRQTPDHVDTIQPGEEFLDWVVFDGPKVGDQPMVLNYWPWGQFHRLKII